MRRWPHSWLSLFVVACALVAPVARADTAAEARFHDERARAAFGARDYEQALEEFFVVRRLIPNPRVDFNVALCFEHLGKVAEAFTHFEGFVRDESSRAPELAELRVYAEAALVRLAPRVALLEITSTPPGGTISVDRRELGAYGTTPRLVAVVPGEHRIWVELPGYRPADSTATVAVGERQVVALTLERVLGRLEVTSRVPGRVRLLDPRGVAVAEGDAPFRAEVPPGPYEIELLAVGHLPWRGVAAVVADEATRREAAPQRSPDSLGDLAISANVAGARVELDGRPAGFSPVVIADLTPGDHAVAVTSEGYVPWRGSVTVTGGERTWVTVSLDGPPRRVRSPLTWAFAGVAATSLVAGATTAIVAESRRDSFDGASAEEQAALAREGKVTNFAADVLTGVGLASFAVGVTLYIRTGRTEGGRSEAAIARDSR